MSAARPGGRVVGVDGPLVRVDGLADVAMAELVALGPDRLPGEVVAISPTVVDVQAYEYTGGLAVGDDVAALGHPLSALLGPHLLGGVFDGLLRPLTDAPTWLGPGARPGATAAHHPWEPRAVVDGTVGPGDLLGVVPRPGLEHLVLVPPDVAGPLTWLAPAGDVTPDEPVAVVDGRPVALASWWPVRRPRPVLERLPADEPLVTGQRVLDAVFPVALGSTVAVPGGFGTGKTMLLQQVAKWCAADVIVYVGCGERGNEMADVLAELAELTDPRTGRRLLERVVVVANTSNMPMMAREAGIVTGVTVGEYFRDMGLHAVVIADSVSRWAEALRELGSRSGALPAEEGYPAVLSSALAAFFERAGRVVTLGGRAASLTVVGAVSPPGGDLTEPVTAHAQRFVRELWTLDRDLAYARHYPAVGWAGSFSRDVEALAGWYAAHGDPGWGARRARVAALLADADRLRDLAELVGAGTLPGHERVVLLGGRLVREGVLQQHALGANDAHCSAAKTAALVDAVLATVDRCDALVARGVPVARLEEADLSPLLRAAQETAPDDAAGVEERAARVHATLGALEPPEPGRAARTALAASEEEVDDP